MKTQMKNKMNPTDRAARQTSEAERLTTTRREHYADPASSVGVRRPKPGCLSAGSSPKQREPRSGRSSLLLLLLVIGAGALVFAWWNTAGQQADSALEGLQPAAASSPASTNASHTLSANPSPGTSEPDRAASPTERGRDPREFEGRGSLRGQILMADGLAFPTAWAVHVGPSRSLRGRERAASKRVELTGESHEFIVEDLPLAGYDVWIEAEGLRSPRRAVLLTRGSSSPYVNLQVTRMGFIDGFVFRESGAAAEDVLVALEPILGQVRREVRTQPDGSYRFDRVEDGEYRLHFGPAETPLVPARELYFRAPSFRFPQVVLPPTADLLIYTQDVKGQLVPNIKVTGFGSKGGLIDIETDATGRAWVRNLVPGLYRIQASANSDELKARKSFEVTLAKDQECWLILR